MTRLKNFEQWKPANVDFSVTTQSWYHVDTIDYRPSKNHEPFSEPILLQIPNSYRLGNLPVFFLKFVVSESSRTSSILSDPLLRIVMNPHRSKIFPCFYTKQITRNPNSNMEQIFSMRLKDWCSKQCIAAEFLSFAEYLHVFSCKSCKSCIPQIRNTSWKFQKQSGAKVTQKWQKDTKTTFSNNFWSSGQTTKIRKFTCGTRKLLSGQSCAWQEVSTSHLSFFIWPQPQQPQCIYFHSLSCLFFVGKWLKPTALKWFLLLRLSSELRSQLDPFCIQTLPRNANVLLL